jgi:hypothetical protein
MYASLSVVWVIRKCCIYPAHKLQACFWVSGGSEFRCPSEAWVHHKGHASRAWPSHHCSTWQHSFSLQNELCICSIGTDLQKDLYNPNLWTCMFLLFFPVLLTMEFHWAFDLMDWEVVGKLIYGYDLLPKWEITNWIPMTYSWQMI